jgi:hypothetical protein
LENRGGYFQDNLKKRGQFAEKAASGCKIGKEEWPAGKMAKRGEPGIEAENVWRRNYFLNAPGGLN